MDCIINLKCCHPSEEICVNTKLLQNIDTNELRISSGARVLENAFYSVTVNLSQVSESIERVQLFLNGTLAGSALCDQLEETETGLKASIVFHIGAKGASTAQLFLLQYDLVQISICVHLASGQSIDFASDYYLCLSKNPEDTENVNAIINALLEFDDDKINRWLFSYNSTVQTSNALTEGSWKDKSYKSVNSFLRLIGDVYICYKNNLSYFRHLARHRIEKKSVLQPYEKVRYVSHTDYTWLLKNSEQLAVTSNKTAISYNGKCYLPYRMKSDKNQKNLDVYENQITLAFLQLVCTHTNFIQKELSKSISNEQKVIERLQGLERDGFRAPILTVKRYQVNLHQGMLERLKAINKELQILYIEYKQILPCQEILLSHFPRKTKGFQEIKPYAEVFKQIVLWFRYGEFDLKKESIIMRVKTIDKLFEYYCLYRLLQMISDAGYIIDESQPSIYAYNYRIVDPRQPIEYDVANTFVFVKDTTKLTLYYQPVIYSSRMENEITLFRTTERDNCFIPDFLIKYSDEKDSNNSRYIVLDSKYSSRKSIIDNYLDEKILRYSCQIAEVNGDANALAMMWILQGRVENMPTINIYHNSPLARQHRPLPSYGIISLNSMTLNLNRLWEEIMFVCKYKKP